MLTENRVSLVARSYAPAKPSCMSPTTSRTALHRTGSRWLLSLAATALLLLAPLLLSSCSANDENVDNDPQVTSEDTSSVDSKVPSSVDSKNNQDLDYSSVPSDARVSPSELSGMLSSSNQPFVLDIRGEGHYDASFIEGSKNIPAGRQLDIRLKEIPSDRELVLVSDNNERDAEVRQTLIDAGFNPDDIKVLDGGMEAWKAAGLPTETMPRRGC